MIQLQDVRYSIGERVLFDRLSWVLSPGDRVALVGPNGAGKSTLFSIILKQKEVSICLVPGTPRAGKADREYFRKQMNDTEYRKQFFTLLASLGPGYWIEIAGPK